MKILHLANTPLSNAPANIASVQKRHGHDALVLLNQKSNRNKVYVGGDLWHDFEPGELEVIFSEADIIHFHNFTWTQEILMKNPHLKDIVKKKKCVVQFHSSRTAVEVFDETIKDPFFSGKKLVIAQYHPRQYPECEYIVPNPIPLHEDRFRIVRKGKWNDFPPLWVSYAPSNTHLQGWDYKGFDQISPALRHLKNATKDIITNTPYENCLRRKSYSHVGIEEFFTGSYHLSFLEYMALECYTVGYLDDQTKQAVKTFIGDDGLKSMPYCEVRSAGQLIEKINYMADHPHETREKAQMSRKWLETYWSTEKTSKAYTDIYEKI